MNVIEKLEYTYLSYEQYFQYFAKAQVLLKDSKTSNDIKRAFLDLLCRCSVYTTLKGQDEEVLKSKLLLIKQIKKLPLSIKLSEEKIREARKIIEQLKRRDHLDHMEPYARYKYEQEKKAREADANISLYMMEQNEKQRK